MKSGICASRGEEAPDERVSRHMNGAPGDTRLWPLADAVSALVARAAHRVIAIYETDFEVNHKQDQSPVTSADLAAHEIISEGLASLEPGVPCLSEEGEIAPFEVRARWQRYWLVDPVDGTRGFAARTGEFTVNVALISAGRPILGVVAIPISGLCCAAVRGGGARLEHANGAREQIRTRRLPAHQVVVLRSRTRRHAEVSRLIAKLGSVRVIRASSSLKACLVARGLADLYPAFGPTSEWDTAASQCLIEEAGGGLTDRALNPLRYNTSESLENPSFIAFGDGSADWKTLLAELDS
jgi:3'(2'), 5'-bisphosphate nucleotidase